MSLKRSFGLKLTRRWQTNRLDDSREIDRLAQFEECDVIIIGVRVEAAMAYDGGDGAHDGRALRCDGLVVVTQDHTDLGPLQSGT